MKLMYDSEMGEARWPPGVPVMVVGEMTMSEYESTVSVLLLLLLLLLLVVRILWLGR